MAKRIRSGKLLVLGANLGLAAAVSAAAPAYAGAVVHWTSPGILLRIMLASPETAGALTGARPDDGVSDAAVRCGADVYRPELGEGWAVRADNRLSCSFPQGATGSALGTATFSLATTGVQAWGNRFDKPLHFSIDDQTSLAFYAALKRAWTAHPQEPYLSQVALCGPDGSCTEDYFLNARPTEDSAAALACSQDSGADGRVTQTRCSFLSF
jgi:hypothetical protein